MGFKKGNNCWKLRKNTVISQSVRNKIRQTVTQLWQDKVTREKYIQSHIGFKPSEEHKNKISIGLKRAYQNGNRKIRNKTELILKIKNLDEYIYWRTTVFKRDNYICQECNRVGGKLEAHHIKELSLIFSEFLQTYSQFSPIEDKETLIRLAMTYLPFWDVDNGITLCQSCHYKTDNYGSKVYTNKGEK